MVVVVRRVIENGNIFVLSTLVKGDVMCSDIGAVLVEKSEFSLGQEEM
jgi:hypothetical protein